MSNSIRGGGPTSNDAVKDNRLPNIEGKEMEFITTTSTGKREK